MIPQLADGTPHSPKRITVTISAVSWARAASLAVRAVGRAFPAAGASLATWPAGTWAGGVSRVELLTVFLRCLRCGGGR